jgi:hypothetical protein
MTTGPAWAQTVDAALTEIDRLPGRHLYFLDDHLLGNRRFAAGLRSLFVGFETVNTANLAAQRKRQNVGRDYAEVVRRLHDLGVMVNASFVFGMDGDRPDVFDRTWPEPSTTASRPRHSTS